MNFILKFVHAFGYLVLSCSVIGAAFAEQSPYDVSFAEEPQSQTETEERSKRSAPTVKNLFWKMGMVFYNFDSSYTDIGAKNFIEKQMRYLESIADIHFVNINPYQYRGIYINILPENDCSSYIGTSFRGQPLHLGSNCLQKVIVLHELMHALGFHHEQSRADRDDHLYVSHKHKKDYNYDKQGDHTTRYGEYDYDSIMQYSGIPIRGTNYLTPYHHNNKDLSKADKDGLIKAYGPAKKLSADELSNAIADSTDPDLKTVIKDPSKIYLCINKMNSTNYYYIRFLDMNNRIVSDSPIYITNYLKTHDILLELNSLSKNQNFKSIIVYAFDQLKGKYFPHTYRLSVKELQSGRCIYDI